VSRFRFGTEHKVITKKMLKNDGLKYIVFRLSYGVNLELFIVLIAKTQ